MLRGSAAEREDEGGASERVQERCGRSPRFAGNHSVHVAGLFHSHTCGNQPGKLTEIVLQDMNLCQSLCRNVSLKTHYACFLRLLCHLIWKRFGTSWLKTSMSCGEWIRLSWAGRMARSENEDCSFTYILYTYKKIITLDQKIKKHNPYILPCFWRNKHHKYTFL